MLICLMLMRKRPKISNVINQIYMEKKTGKVKMADQGECCGMMHGHCHSHGGRRICRSIFSIVLVVLIIGAVVHIGAWGRYGGMMENGYGYGYGMMGGCRGGSEGTFGTISKIDKNMITIVDNAGEMETFKTTAKTSIFRLTGPVGLGALKSGNDVIISAKGDRDDDNAATSVLEARTIRVVEPVAPTVPVSPALKK